MRRRDASDASNRLMSFSVEGRGSGVLLRSSWRICGGHFNNRQPSGLNKLNLNISTARAVATDPVLTGPLFRSPVTCLASCHQTLACLVLPITAVARRTPTQGP